MLDRAAPKGFFSKALELFGAEALVTTVYPGTFRGDGEFRLRDAEYRIRAEGTVRKDYELFRGDEGIAEASNASLVGAAWKIESDSVRGELKRDLVATRGFSLVSEAEILGTLKPAAPVLRTALLEFSPIVPEDLQIFFAWMVTRQWRGSTRFL